MYGHSRGFQLVADIVGIAGHQHVHIISGNGQNAAKAGCLDRRGDGNHVSLNQIGAVGNRQPVPVGILQQALTACSSVSTAPASPSASVFAQRPI
jgi:hypothetical protein